MNLPPSLIDEARRRAGVGPSTLLTFPIWSGDGASEIFRTLFRFPALRVDVIGANIGSSRGIPLGALMLLVHGEPTVIRDAIAAFEKQAICLEVVGHVTHVA